MWIASAELAVVPGQRLYERLNEVLEEGASMSLLGTDRVNTKPEVRHVAPTTVLKLSALGYRYSIVRLYFAPD